MAVSAEQSRANVKTALAIVARDMGLYVNDGSGFAVTDVPDINQRIALTNALAAYILAHPTAFDELTLWNASQTSNPQLAPDPTTTEKFGDFVDAFTDNARAINPLDPQNIQTTGKWLFFGALALGAVWIVVRFLPESLKRASKS